MNPTAKQIANAKQQVKLMAKLYGRASQQYQDAVRHHSDLLIKQIQRKEL